MNARHAANDDLPFSYPVKVGHISANPVRIGLEASAEELKALAKFWDVVSVEYLKAEPAGFPLEEGWREDQG